MIDRILCFAEDPGAANCFIGLTKALEHTHSKVLIMATKLSREYFNQRNEPSTLVSHFSEMHRNISDFNPTKIITGTSENRKSLSLALIKYGQRMKIPTLGYVDSPANSEFRFSGTTGNPSAYLPDKILVADSVTHANFTKLGIGKNKIVVIGNPYYDWLIQEVDTNKKRYLIANKKKYFNLPDKNTKIITIVSEKSFNYKMGDLKLNRYSDLVGRGTSNQRTNIIIEEIIDYCKCLDPKPYLILRIHPKDEIKNYKKYFKELDRISANESPLKTILASDVIIGLTTSLLVEATILGKRTLSVLINPEEANLLYGIQSGIVPCATSRKALRRALKRMLSLQESPKRASFEKLLGRQNLLALLKA
jgi:hypothetical protein